MSSRAEGVDGDGGIPRGQAGVLCESSENHSGAGVSLGGLQQHRVTTCRREWEHP